ncbi:MAG: helix-turn-helix domain-containing protein [Rhizobiaceae bacterium]
MESHADTRTGTATGSAAGGGLKPQPRGKAQAAKSERMRAAILDEAVRTLSEMGYHATSIKKIAAQGGFSIGAIQHHFRSKEALMVAVVEKALLRAERFFERFGAGSGDMGAMVRESWAKQINSPWYMAMLEILVAARTDRTLRERVAPALETYARETETRMARLVSGGKPGSSEDKAAFLLTVSRCMMGGFLVQDALAMPGTQTASFIERWGQFLNDALKE